MTQTPVVVRCDECGWTCEDRPSIAAKRLRRHGDPCPKPIVVRDCVHGGRHRHGTLAAYLSDQCRCRPCRIASAAARARAYRHTVMGKPLNIAPGAAIGHIAALEVAGLGRARIAELAGVSTASVTQLALGYRKQIHRDTAAAILAVNVQDATPALGANVDSTGTARRIQALVALGWGCREIERRTGLSANFARRVAMGTRGVTQRTKATIAGLYDDLWDQQPPARSQGQRTARTVALRLAAREGWVSPLAWDDETIDDPKAVPDLGRYDEHVPKCRLDVNVIERRLGGEGVRMSRDERLVVVGRMRDVGYSARQIAEQVGRTQRQVVRDVAEIEANANRDEQAAS